jgi:hypothetical protein
VIDALARALRLDHEERSYLHVLGRRARTQPAPLLLEQVSDGIRLILLSWQDKPAYVLGRTRDILFSNPLATCLAPLFRPGHNQLIDLFLDGGTRQLIQNWDDTVADAVAAFRFATAAYADDVGVRELVADLSARSEAFRELWSRHDAGHRPTGVVVFDHPSVGRLALRYEKLAVMDAPSQTIIVYHAEPGSPSERELALLASGVEGTDLS